MAEGQKGRPFMKSLRGRVTLQMLLVGLTPLAIVGLMVLWSMSTAQFQASESVEETRAALEEEVVGANLEEVTSGFLGQMITGHAAMAWRMAQVPVLIEAVESGNANNPAAEAFLEEEVARCLWAQMVVANETGAVVAGVDSMSMGLPDSLAGGEAYETAITNGLAVGCPVYTEVLGVGLFQIDYAARIEDSQGNGITVGVLQGSMIGPAELVDDIFVSQIEEAKVVMFHKDTGELLLDTSDFTRHSQESIELTELEEEVATAIVANEQSTGHFSQGGNVAVFVRLSSTAGDAYPATFRSLYNEAAPWAIMVQQPESVAFAGLEPVESLERDLQDSTNAMVITLAIVLVAALAAALIAAFYLSRSVTQPVSELRDVAEKVSCGDTSVTIPEGRDDEIGDLAESFGRMVRSVQYLSMQVEEDD